MTRLGIRRVKESKERLKSERTALIRCISRANGTINRYVSSVYTSMSPGCTASVVSRCKETRFLENRRINHRRDIVVRIFMYRVSLRESALTFQ